MGKSTRKSKNRVIKKRIIIAMEGSKTESRYFDSLIKKLELRNDKSLHVKLLKRSKTDSSPLNVIESLNKERCEIEEEYGKQEKDEFWVVIDRDNWSTEALDKVASQAEKKKYCLADSNPCFELWLLLHHKRLRELKGLEGRAATGGCDSVKKELKKVDKNYDKSKYNTERYIEKIGNAIQYAKETDTEPQTRWLNSIGTRVYLLAQSVIDSSSPQPLNN